MTFDKISKENNGLVKGKKTDSHYFGKIERFGNSKKKKSQSFSVPGPGFYNVLYEWKGKKSKKDEKSEKKTDISSVLSKGIDKSLYYD